MSQKKLADRLGEALRLRIYDLDCSYPAVTPPRRAPDR
jgi:hypothetical protein